MQKQNINSRLKGAVDHTDFCIFFKYILGRRERTKEEKHMCNIAAAGAVDRELGGEYIRFLSPNF